MDRISPDLTLSWRDKRNRRLSDRIWSNRQDVRRRIDETLREGIRNGDSVDDIANDLISFIRPSHARYGSGRARYAADRLARNETKRAHGLAARDVSLADPDGGFMQYSLNRMRHIEAHDCDEYANHDQGLGRGIWPARRCPIPNIDTHVGCQCEVTPIPYSEIELGEGRAAVGMDEFVEQLRADYGLADPTDLSPAELAVFRRETAQIREDVVLMFNGWFEQTGLVSREQLLDSSPTVRDWVSSVRAAKQRRKGR